MRKVLAAATFGLVLGVAGASNSDEQNPESRVYLGFSFGGQKIAPRNFHYGLRIDHDSRFIEGPVAPLMQFDFTPRGFNDAHVNGLSVIRPAYRLRQAEESAAAEPAVEEVSEPAAEAPAEEVSEVEEVEGEAAAEGEPGFFSKTWTGITGFFDGLFGGGEEQVAEDAAAPAEAPAEETAAADDVTEGSFLNYSVVDWGLLAVGAVGLGFAVGEVSNAIGSPDSGGGGGPGGPGGGGCPPGQVPNPVPDPLNQFPDCIPAPPGFIGSARFGGVDIRDPGYQEWLDGGTGHMGDLEPRSE